MWFIMYRRSTRPGEAGIKFVQDEATALAEKDSLESQGYVVAKVAPNSKTHMGAFLAGSLLSPKQPLLG